MNTYYLNDTPLGDFGFLPGHASGSNLALSGVWDMPPRTGDSFHEWTEQDGVEAYVDPADIRFGGREIQLTGHLIGDHREELLDRIDRFRTFLQALPETSVLRCDWGEWAVHLKKEVKIAPRDRIAPVTLSFYEPQPAQPDWSGSQKEWPDQWILAAGYWNEKGCWDNPALWYGYPQKPTLDQWLWESFGLIVSATDGIYDLPTSREIKTTQPTPALEWVKGGLDKHSVTLTATLRADDLTAFNRQVRSLFWLFGQDRLRQLHYNGRHYSLFATEGFKITAVQKRQKVYAKLNIKLLEAHE